MRESGSVKLYWSLSRGPGVGGLGGRPPRPAAAACRYFPLAQFGLVGRLLGGVTLLGTRLQRRFRCGQARQPLLAASEFIGDDQAVRQRAPVRLLAQREQRLHLGGEPGFQPP